MAGAVHVRPTICTQPISRKVVRPTLFVELLITFLRVGSRHTISVSQTIADGVSSPEATITAFRGSADCARCIILNAGLKSMRIDTTARSIAHCWKA